MIYLNYEILVEVSHSTVYELDKDKKPDEKSKYDEKKIERYIVVDTLDGEYVENCTGGYLRFKSIETAMGYIEHLVYKHDLH